MFGKVMQTPDEQVAKHVFDLLEYVSKQEETKLFRIIKKLNKDYPNDIGNFAPFILNYMILQPGEAIFLQPNEPHAYLYGECFECMACSDNVVRAGLTPKLKDVPTLLSLLTFNLGAVKILKGEAVNKYIRKYDCPVDEFQIEQITFPHAKESTEMLCKGPSIIMVYKGSAKLQVENVSLEGKKGEGFFILPGQIVKIESLSNDTILFRSTVNEKFYN